MGPRLFGVIALSFILVPLAFAGQVPGPASAPDIPITHRDRVYAAEQFSNTVSVIDPATNTLLGVIRLGEPQPANLSPLYRGQLLVHGLGFSPDRRTLAVVSIGSNSVSFIDTATNAVKHVTYVGRSPHEAFFTPNGKEVWVPRSSDVSSSPRHSVRISPRHPKAIRSGSR
jgi:YVTN family beta-propeller protein